MNFGSFEGICFMDKKLKIGLVFMVAAVVLMPIAILLKSVSGQATIALLIFTMCLELIGLTFVVLSILKRKKS